MDRRHAIQRLSLTLLVGICSALTVALAAFTLSRTSSYAPASAYTRARAEEAARILMANREVETSPVAQLEAAAEPEVPAEFIEALAEMPAPVPAATVAVDPVTGDELSPYRGGMGGGDNAVRTLNTEKQVLPRSRGGIADGNASNKNTLLLKPQYLGGLNDGHTGIQTPFIYKAQYLGGLNDGFTGKQTPFIYKAQYLGGLNDGFTGKQTPFIYKAQYLGGLNDGFTSLQTPFIYKAQYLGGLNDGFTSEQTPFIFKPQYLGGLNDGFDDRQSPLV